MLVERMTDALHHRGPDARGFCWGRKAHLGATRLSIIDPDSGAQPTYNETGRLCIIFNGEIYNHHQLRADLRRSGHCFASETDTEVVIHLYEEYGEQCVHRLRGMFAFAILDEDRLFLARDRLGIKPLYYALLPEAQLFLFASEIKAILQCPQYTPRLDMRAFADSVVLGYPAGTETYLEGIRTLAPGHTMTVECGDAVKVGEQLRYFHRDWVRDEAIGFEEAQHTLENALREAITTHLAADVEVGLTLSGGLDSTVLALLAAEQSAGPAMTFTVADDEQHPDLMQGRLVAEMTGGRHFSIVPTFDDYLRVIPGYIAAEEVPSTLSGLPFYFLCQKIATYLKVCLHGEGADELFGGYREYLDRQYRLSYMLRRLPLLKQLGALPSDRVLEIAEGLSASRFDDYLEQVFRINLSDTLERQHLNPVDKCGMAAGVEIRVPYLDDAVVELVGGFPLRHLVRTDLGIRKYILRRLCLKRFGSKTVDVLLREKLGVPSACVQYMDRFDRLCNETLPDDYLSRHELGNCFESKRQLLLFDFFTEIFVTHRGNSENAGGVLDFLRMTANGRPLAALAE